MNSLKKLYTNCSPTVHQLCIRWELLTNFNKKVLATYVYLGLYFDHRSGNGAADNPGETKMLDATTITIADLNKCIVSWTYWGGTVIDFINPATGRTVIYGKSLEDVQAEHSDAELITFDEYSAKKAAMQRTPITWDDSTEEAYDYSLNCLPPAYTGCGGFLVGEPYDHDAGTGEPRFTAFKKRGNSFFQSSRPLTVKEFKAEAAN